MKVQELQAQLKKLHDENLVWLNGDEGYTSPVVYHYTSLESAQSILLSGKIRLTDIRFLNDPQELKEGLNIADDVFRKVVSKYNDLSYTELILHLIYVLKSTAALQDEIKTLNEKYLEEHKKYFKTTPKPLSDRIHKIFIACFSEDKDDLRQWISYASNATGVAIGMEGVKNSDLLTTDDDGVMIIRVCYEDNQKKSQYLEQIFDGLFPIYKQAKAASLLGDFFWHVYLGLFGDLVACKSPNYADENEWRLIYAPDYLPKDLPKKIVNYYEKNGLIKPYVEVGLKRDNLKELVLGPKTEESLNRQSLSDITGQKAYVNAIISKSTISYRG